MEQRQALYSGICVFASHASMHRSFAREPVESPLSPQCHGIATTPGATRWFDCRPTPTRALKPRAHVVPLFGDRVPIWSEVEFDLAVTTLTH